MLLRLPSGQRLERRFSETDKLEVYKYKKFKSLWPNSLLSLILQSVYDFAYTAEGDELPHKFVLITNFPRHELHTDSDGGPMLKDLSLGRKCVLFVHDVTED